MVDLKKVLNQIIQDAVILIKEAGIPVKWDRYTLFENQGDFYGWINRNMKGKVRTHDFVCIHIDLEEDRVFSIGVNTSSVKYSKQFTKLFGLVHVSCKKMEVLE